MLSQLTPITTAIASYAHDVSWPAFTPGDLRTLAVFTVFFLLFALEARCAYRQHAPAAVRQSYFTNLGSFILNDTLMSLLAVSSLWIVAERYAHHGLLSGMASTYVKGLVSLLLLDLTLYSWHRINHQVDALWMLHKVHHSDRCMNVSTAFRLHGGEIVLTTLVKAAFIVLVGIDSAVLLANEAVITLFVMFHHSNLTFHGERWLGRFIVVPYLHRTHHSVQRSEHDRNYGAVLSLWDRLFGTYAEQEPVNLGLRQVPGQNLIELVKFGLIRNVPPHPQPLLQPQALQAMIAEAAYFRAEQRGFVPGDEFVDWLEAEKEILGAIGPLSQPRRSLNWTALRRMTRTIVEGVAARLRRHGKNMPNSSGKRLPGLAMARLCAQD